MEYLLNDNEVACYDFGYRAGVYDTLTEISKVFDDDAKIEEIRIKMLEGRGKDAS